jgi:hypothetical protein
VRGRAGTHRGDTMIRRLSNLVPAVSLVLCVEPCVLWVRS